MHSKQINPLEKYGNESISWYMKATKSLHYVSIILIPTRLFLS